MLGLVLNLLDPFQHTVEGYTAGRHAAAGRAKTTFLWFSAAARST
jgi:hypothetical protein